MKNENKKGKRSPAQLAQEIAEILYLMFVAWIAAD